MLTYYFEAERAYKYGSIFRPILQDREGWTLAAPAELDAPATPATLSDKNSRSLFKSYVDGEEAFILKHNLARMMRDEPFMPASIIIARGKLQDPIIDMPKGGIVFLKPSDKFTGEGKDIMLFSSMGAFLEEKEKGRVPLSKYPLWVLQAEVSPPMLIDGRKFVIRFFSVLIYGSRAGKHPHRDHRKGVTFSAKKARVNLYAREYEPHVIDPLSMISHNTENLTQASGTRIGSREGLFSLDGAHVGYEELMRGAWSRMREIAAKVFERSAPSLLSPHSHALTVYGYDFVLRDDGAVFLLEINEHPLLEFDPPILRDIISTPLLTDCVRAIESIMRGEPFIPHEMEALTVMSIRGADI